LKKGDRGDFNGGTRRGRRESPPPPFSKGGSKPADLGGSTLIRPYRNGRDLTDRPRGVGVIDLHGLTAEEVRTRHPALYQWVLERVKPERDAKAHSPDGAAYARLWWLHGKPRPELRKTLAGLPRYIATVETAKHRTFQFLDAAIAPDNMLVCIALADAYALGVLSSRVHVTWALAVGGRLGVGNDPRYNKTRCFDPFPFPDPTPARQACIRALAKELDAHRKRVFSPPPPGEGQGERVGGIPTPCSNVLSPSTPNAPPKKPPPPPRPPSPPRRAGAGGQTALARQPAGTGGRRGPGAGGGRGAPFRGRPGRPLQRKGHLEETPAATAGHLGGPGPGAGGGRRLASAVGWLSAIVHWCIIKLVRSKP